MENESLGELGEALLALHIAELPKPPNLPERFGYSAETAISRAKAGSISDARVLMAIAAGMLRAQQAGMAVLPAWMADYLSVALDKVARGQDAAIALGVKRKRGKNHYDNEVRDAGICYMSEAYKFLGHRNFLEMTADSLSKLIPPPRVGGEWTASAVSDVIAAHKDRIK